MPAPRDTYVNPLLTDISVAYKNESFIFDQLFPRVMVNKETGTYFVMDKSNLRAPGDAKRSELSRANRVAWGLTSASYSLTERALETPITDRVMRNYSDPLVPKTTATNLVSDLLLLDAEKDLQATILASGAPGLDENSSWSTISTDIIGHVRTAKSSVQKNTGKKANTIVIGKPALDVLLNNTAFIDRVKYTTIATEQALKNAIAGFFDIPTVLFADAIENTAKEGQTDVLDYIWGDTVIVAYVERQPALESPCAGYTLTLENARYVDEWYEEAIKTTFVRANDFYDSKIVDPNAMYVFTDVV